MKNILFIVVLAKPHDSLVTFQFRDQSTRLAVSHATHAYSLLKFSFINIV